MVERGPETTLSSLLIQKATRKGPRLFTHFFFPLRNFFVFISVRFLDSGIYVCSPSSAPAASTAIHVLEGNFPV